MDEEKGKTGSVLVLIPIPKEKCKVYRVIVTCLIYMAFFSFGISYTLWGPTWLDLQKLLGLSPDRMKWGVFVRYIGYAFGALLGGLLFDLLNRKAIIIGALIVSGITVALTPICSEIIGFLVLQTFYGISVGAIDTGCNVWIFELWRDSSNSVPYVQGLQLFFALGSLLAPLMSEPFLSKENWQDVVLQSNVTENLTSTLGSSAGYYGSRIYIPFTITGIISIISGLLIAITFNERFNETECADEQFNNNECSSSDLTESSVDIKPSDRRRTSSIISAVAAKAVAGKSQGKSLAEENMFSSGTVVLLASALLFFFEGMENTSFQYLMTFNVSTALHLPKARGSFMNAAFQASYAIGRGLGVLSALYVRPVSVIALDIFVVGMANIVLMQFANTSASGMWAGSVLLGLGFSTFYGNTLSYVSSLTRVTNLVGGLLIVSGVIASAIYPLIIGGKLESEPLLLIQANLISVVAVSIFLATLLIYVHSRVKRRMQYLVL